MKNAVINRFVFGIALAVAIVGDASASVITHTCTAALSAGVPMSGGTGGLLLPFSGPPCSATVGGHGSGPTTPTALNSGSYAATVSASYSSSLQSNDSGFTLMTGVSGQGSLTLISNQIAFPPGSTGFTMTLGAVLSKASSNDTFSVDTPYSFTLNFSALNDSTVGFSKNFFGAEFGTDLYTFGPGTTGLLTGMLFPGEQYSIVSSFDEIMSGAASEGQTKTYTGNWGGQLTRLEAVAVPSPGSAGLMLSGFLIFSLALRRRQVGASAT